MNTKMIVGIVGVIILIGGIAYFAMGKGGTESADTSSAQQATPSSMKELMASGVSQRCTFNDAPAGSATQGTVYIGGGKVRTDFTSQSSSGSVSGHMIADGTTIYTWMDNMSTGFKMSMSATQSSSSGSSQQGIDVNKKVDYNCSPWSVDASLFVVPTSITFSDMSAMMQGSAGAGASAGGNAAQCQACASLSGSAQAQCKAALGCK